LKSKRSVGITPKPRDANQNCPFPQFLVPKMSKPSPIPKQGRETKKTSKLRHPIPRKPPALVKQRTCHRRLGFIVLSPFSREANRNLFILFSLIIAKTMRAVLQRSSQKLNL
jgi:hypothetical protein